MIRGIIFDFDGTLVEFPKDFLFQETERILQLLGIPAVSRKIHARKYPMRWLLSLALHVGGNIVAYCPIPPQSSLIHLAEHR